MKTVGNHVASTASVIAQARRSLYTAPAKAVALVDEYLRDTKGLSSSDKADLYLQRAIANRMLGHYHDAIADLERALPICTSADLPAKLGTLHFNLGTCYIYTLEYKKAHTHLHTALRINEEDEDNAGLVKTCIALGALLLNIDDYTNALVYLFKAKEEAETAGIDRYEGAINSNISEIYFKTRHFTLSFEYAERSLRKRAKDDFIGQAYSLNSLGNTLIELGEVERGIRYLRRAYQLRKKIGNSMSIANSLLNIGIGYQRLRDGRRALYYLRKSVEEAYRSENHYSISAGHHFLGVALFEKGAVAESIEHMQKALEYSTTVAVPSNELDIRTQLAEYYRRMNLHEQQAQELRLCADLKDRILNESRERSIVALELQHELKQVVHERDQYRQHAENFAQALASTQKDLLAATLNLTKKSAAMRSIEGILKLNGTTPRGDDILLRHTRPSIQPAERESGIEHYEALYGTFIAKLRTINAALTPTEIRMCILIRLNLSIKQIADTLFIAEGTVKQHRNHIRKKLHFSEKDNLGSFLLSL